MNISEQVFKDLPREAQVYISKLEYDLWHDRLTGVTAKQPFVEICEHELAHLRRARTKGFALMFIDINNFKSINDTLGHKVGDEILVEISVIIRQAVRTVDVVGRYGGDEFMVFLQDAVVSEEVLPIIERINKSFEKNMITGRNLPPLGLSLGIAFADTETISIEELMKKADALMYEAKKEKTEKTICYKISGQNE